MTRIDRKKAARARLRACPRAGGRQRTGGQLRHGVARHRLPLGRRHRGRCARPQRSTSPSATPWRTWKWASRATWKRRREDFGGFVDVVFMGVGSNDVRQGIRVNTDVDLTAMDLAFVWSPGPEPMTGIEVFGGLRYIDTGFRPRDRSGAAGTAGPADGRRQELLRPAGRRALRGADQRALAPGVQRRPVRGRYRRHLEPRRLRRLPDRPAPFLCGLPARRNGLRRCAPARPSPRPFPGPRSPTDFAF